MSELKYGKATGVDFTLAKTQPNLESPRVPGRTGKHDLFEICSNVYRKGHWMRHFTESIIIPIENKQGPRKVGISKQTV